MVRPDTFFFMLCFSLISKFCVVNINGNEKLHTFCFVVYLLHDLSWSIYSLLDMYCSTHSFVIFWTAMSFMGYAEQETVSHTLGSPFFVVRTCVCLV